MKDQVTVIQKCYDIFIFCRPMLMDKPDIVVGTPSRFIAHLKAGNMEIKNSVEMVVVDEADLVFSFGYESDVKALMRYIFA